ncbi:hypothetical protein ACWC9U_13995 [Streptomyces sp. 900116325]
MKWDDANGHRSAVVRVAAGQREGGHVRIWFDGQGRVTSPPIRPEAAVSAGLAVGGGTAVGTAAAAFAARKIVRITVDRHRLVEWGREWERVESRWTGRTGMTARAGGTRLVAVRLAVDHGRGGRRGAQRAPREHTA